MTRTDLILAAMTHEIERRRCALDADDGVQKVLLTLKLNEAGVPRYVTVNTESMRDLTIDRRK